MSCTKCGSDLLVGINAKSSDLNFVQFKGLKHDGYAPDFPGVCEGDYVDIEFCAHCGTIQDFEPMTDKQIRQALSDVGCAVTADPLLYFDICAGDEFSNRYMGKDERYTAVCNASYVTNRDYWTITGVASDTGETMEFDSREHVLRSLDHLIDDE
jgi:hypothetical protein